MNSLSRWMTKYQMQLTCKAHDKYAGYNFDVAWQVNIESF